MPEEKVSGKVAKNYTILYTKKFAARPVYKGTVMVDINIAYPQITTKNNQDVSQRISNFYRDSARQYYDYASHTLYDDAVKTYLDSLQRHIPFHEYQVMQTYETPFNHPSFLSLYFDRYEFTGGAHGNTVRIADTWYLPGGERIALSDFFRDSYYKSIIYEYITNSIREQIAQGNTYYFEDYAKNVFRFYDEKNYYLTDKGIAIFYPLYTIAAYVQGIPVFVIPYEVFGHSLKGGLFE